MSLIMPKDKRSNISKIPNAIINKILSIQDHNCKVPGLYSSVLLFLWGGGGGHASDMWKLPDQGLNQCHSSDLSCRHRNDNVESLTHCTTSRTPSVLLFYYGSFLFQESPFAISEFFTFYHFRCWIMNKCLIFTLVLELKTKLNFTTQLLLSSECTRPL